MQLISIVYFVSPRKAGMVETRFRDSYLQRVTILLGKDPAWQHTLRLLVASNPNAGRIAEQLAPMFDRASRALGDRTDDEANNLRVEINDLRTYYGISAE